MVGGHKKGGGGQSCQRSYGSSDEGEVKKKGTQKAAVRRADTKEKEKNCEETTTGTNNNLSLSRGTERERDRSKQKAKQDIAAVVQ